MRFKSESSGGVQVFAVCGTNTVSFGLSVDAPARKGLLGFAVHRTDEDGREEWMYGYKVFESLVPKPTPATWVSTEDHPIQSLVWDDFTAEPGTRYVYDFHPLRGTPQQLDRSSPVVTV